MSDAMPTRSPEPFEPDLPCRTSTSPWLGAAMLLMFSGLCFWLWSDSLWKVGAAVGVYVALGVFVEGVGRMRPTTFEAQGVRTGWLSRRLVPYERIAAVDLHLHYARVTLRDARRINLSLAGLDSDAEREQMIEWLRHRIGPTVFE